MATVNQRWNRLRVLKIQKDCESHLKIEIMKNQEVDITTTMDLEKLDFKQVETFARREFE